MFGHSAIAPLAGATVAEYCQPSTGRSLTFYRHQAILCLFCVQFLLGNHSRLHSSKKLDLRAAVLGQAPGMGLFNIRADVKVKQRVLAAESGSGFLWLDKSN